MLLGIPASPLDETLRELRAREQDPHRWAYRICERVARGDHSMRTYAENCAREVVAQLERGHRAQADDRSEQDKPF